MLLVFFMDVCTYSVVLSGWGIVIEQNHKTSIWVDQLLDVLLKKDSMKLSSLQLYFNTLRYMKPIQIPYLIKNRLPNRDSFNKYPLTDNVANNWTIFIPDLDEDNAYLERFKVEEISQGQIRLLNHAFETKNGWYDEHATPLENFNLHYFEFAIALAVAGKQSNGTGYAQCLSSLYSNWIDCWDIPIAKHPYTTSLRITHLLIACSVLDNKEILKSLYPQYRYLLKHQEKGLLGNHYFENLKAIVLCSLIYEEEKIFDAYYPKFLNELEEQILEDGVHFERSLMYHKIVLEGIIRVAFLLNQFDKKSLTQPLLDKIQSMITAGFSLERSMGKTPFFNDAAENVAKDMNQLIQAASCLFGIEPEDRQAFPVSGYYKVYSRDCALMFDAGEIGPHYLPGHSHCDCLSFELSFRGKPLFVNSGTYGYQGSKRSYFRSTRAHNTVTIDNAEQMECWGEHRVGRRLSKIQGSLNQQTVIGSFINYLGQSHNRTINLKDGYFRVIDKTTGIGIIRSFLHVNSFYRIDTNEYGLRVLTVEDNWVCDIQPIACEFIIHSDGELTQYSTDFGQLTQTRCIEFFWNADSIEHGYQVEFCCGDLG